MGLTTWNLRTTGPKFIMGRQDVTFLKLPVPSSIKGNFNIAIIKSWRKSSESIDMSPAWSERPSTFWCTPVLWQHPETLPSRLVFELPLLFGPHDRWSQMEPRQPMLYNVLHLVQETLHLPPLFQSLLSNLLLYISLAKACITESGNLRVEVNLTM